MSCCKCHAPAVNSPVPALLPAPQVQVPISNSVTADFSTTYLSAGVRVARGKSGNVFLFRKLP